MSCDPPSLATTEGHQRHSLGVSTPGNGLTLGGEERRELPSRAVLLQGRFLLCPRQWHRLLFHLFPLTNGHFVNVCNVCVMRV